MCKAVEIPFFLRPPRRPPFFFVFFYISYIFAIKPENKALKLTVPRFLFVHVLRSLETAVHSNDF